METTRESPSVDQFAAECDGATYVTIEGELAALTLDEAREIRDALSNLDLGE